MEAATGDRVFALVTRLLRSNFDVEVEKLRPDALVVDDLDLDSLDAVDLVAQLEEETGVLLSDDAMSGVRTLEDVVQLVRAGLARAPS